jgi:hypothetical protein
MRRLFCLLVVVSLATLARAGQVAYMDGNRLLGKCEPGISEDRGKLTGDQIADSAFCSGYVAGVMDANNALMNSVAAVKDGPIRPMYCLPSEGIEVGQAVRITVKWLKAHPEKLHLQGDALVWMSLTDAFPCQ